jgi:hypothetical protein
VLIESLGICLPCQVISADLRMAYASARRSARLLTLPYSTQTARPVRRANCWLPVGDLVVVARFRHGTGRRLGGINLSRHSCL